MNRARGGEIKRQTSLKALRQCSMFKDQEATLMLKFRTCETSCASLVLLNIKHMSIRLMGSEGQILMRISA